MNVDQPRLLIRIPRRTALDRTALRSSRGSRGRSRRGSSRRRRRRRLLTAHRSARPTGRGTFHSFHPRRSAWSSRPARPGTVAEHHVVPTVAMMAVPPVADDIAECEADPADQQDSDCGRDDLGCQGCPPAGGDRFTRRSRSRSRRCSRCRLWIGLGNRLCDALRHRFVRIRSLLLVHHVSGLPLFSIQELTRANVSGITGIPVTRNCQVAVNAHKVAM